MCNCGNLVSPSGILCSQRSKVGELSELNHNLQILEVELFVATEPTNIIQMFGKITLNIQVIIKSINDPDYQFRSDHVMCCITWTASLLLGNNENTILINYVIIVTKQEIYRWKWKNNIPTFRDLKQVLKNFMKIEIYIGTITLEKTMGKWSTIYNDL